MTELGEQESRGRDERSLEAYHDGELGWLARRRFERRLARSPELRRELAALERLGELAREAEAEATAPDLWSSIARELPAIDAEREAQRGGWLGWLTGGGGDLRPLAAAAAVGEAAVALLYDRGGEQPIREGGAPEPSPSVVRWIDPGSNGVLLLEGNQRATIIWVLDAPAETSGSRGGRHGVV